MSNESEVRAQVLGRLLDAVLGALLVMQETKLKGSLRLRLIHLRFFIAKIEHVH